jgi:hypothetical protein
MTKSNCIITCEFNMTEYARLFTYEALTEDTCAGTRTRVTEGSVAVRDLNRKRTVIVRAGHSYLARRFG